MGEASSKAAKESQRPYGLSAEDIYKLTGFKLVVILDEDTTLEDIDYLHERVLTDPITISAFIAPDGTMANGLFVDRAYEEEGGETSFEPRLRYVQLSSSIMFEAPDIPLASIQQQRLPALTAPDC